MVEAVLWLLMLAVRRMICTASPTDHVASGSRQELAQQRALAARAQLEHCRLCVHECGSNRLAGELGICRAGPTARIFSAQIEVGDEVDLVPAFAIAFSGCELRCRFCLTAASSWNSLAGSPLDCASVARRAARALGGGARAVLFLGGEPTVHLPAALELAARLPEDARLVWKTNALGSAEARELLDGVFNVWVADYKFGSDACAARLAGFGRYLGVVRENLLWMRLHTDLIVRHLLIPGHVRCCWAPVAEWLAAEMRGVKVSLRDSYWPSGGSAEYPELRGAISAEERRTALAIARSHDLNLIR
jgi:putative pyruvate formate lyase activating enzyme